jgi:Proteasome subunit
MSRPFGVALLIAGYDEDGPQLYHAEPSGTFYRYDAKAIGSGSEGAQAELQNEYHKVCFNKFPPSPIVFYNTTFASPCRLRERVLVPFYHRRRDAGVKDTQAGHGGETRFQKCTAGKCNQGARVQDIHRRRDGRSSRAATCELRPPSASRVPQTETQDRPTNLKTRAQENTAPEPDEARIDQQYVTLPVFTVTSGQSARRSYLQMTLASRKPTHSYKTGRNKGRASQLHSFFRPPSIQEYTNGSLQVLKFFVVGVVVLQRHAIHPLGHGVHRVP